VEEAIQEAHPYFQDQSEEPEEQVLELLRGLSPEAQRNLLEIVNAPKAEA